jgi:hypothetical protein
MARITSFGYMDLSVPIDEWENNVVMNPGGDAVTHLNIKSFSQNNAVIYTPGPDDQVYYFDKNDNVLISRIQTEIRGPEKAASWLKDMKISIGQELSDGTNIQAADSVLGASAAPNWSPFDNYFQSSFFPRDMDLQWFFNTHPAAQALNTRFFGSFDYKFKMTDTDLRDFYRVNDGDDYQAHHIYITHSFTFHHTLPLTLVA